MTKDKPELKTIAIDKLQRGRYQPRREFDAEKIEELAKSLISAGMIQPVVVRPITADSYEIVAGERRWRAAQAAGLDRIPCLINCYSDEQMAAVTTIENINRVDLNPVEEAEAYQRLIDEFDYLHEEVAAIVGKSRTKITNSLRLLKLDERVRQYLIQGNLSEGHGKVLAGLPAELQYQLATLTITHSWNVRQLEKEAKRIQEEKGESIRKDPNISRLETALSNHIGCKVEIDYSNQKRLMKIDFHNLEILQGLLQKMGFKE